MAEPAKQQIGDGQDNFGQAAGKAAQAAKQISQEAAKQAAVKGAEATANAAAATVQAGVEGGKAVAEIAAGTAAGGPWGAIISAAWAMRHTLFKILICICLFLLIIITLICSLPSIVLDSVFGLNGTPPAEGTTLESSYSDMSEVVSAVIDAGYDQSLARVEEIILDGGYDYDLSMDALINHAQASAGYDVCYILAAYSASLQQQGATVDDMVAKLEAISDQMFPVTYEVETQERLVPVSYSTYKSVTVTVVTRKHILTTALSLVGKVPYFWGGKSAAGWNDEWNTPKLVTSAGSSSTGTIRPFGLDCSGFTDWTYKTAVGVSLHAGTYGQWDNSYAIDESELLPGDLGFLMNEGGSGWNHVLIFAGYGEDGSRKWVHSEGGIGVHLNTPSYEGRLALRRPKNVNFEQEVGSSAYGEPLYSLQVNVTHYCACTRCCGPNAQGITASGKRVAVGMVAMSSHYPFGTQIMINGIMYTVEDRGGSGIENDIGRVDIYVPDHNEALRMGRYDTTAYIYRIGR